MLEIDFTYSAMSLKMNMGHCMMTEGNKRKDGLKNILTQIPFLGNVKKSVPSLNYHWKSHKCASVFLCCQNLTTIHSIFLRFIPFGHRFLTISINLTVEALVVFTRQNFSKWHKGEMIVFLTELQGSILKCMPTSKQRSKWQWVIACIWPKLFAKNLMSQFQDYVGHPITEKSRTISFPFH